MKRLSYLALVLALSAGIAGASTLTFSNPSNLGNGGVSAYPKGAKAVTPSDTDTFERPVMIYVGGASCNIVVTPANGASNVTFTGMPAGSIVPVQVTAVLSTNTTCTNVVAVY